MRKSSQIKAKLAFASIDQVKDKSRERLKAASSWSTAVQLSSCLAIAIAIARLTWLALSAKHLLILLHEVARLPACLPVLLHGKCCN